MYWFRYLTSRTVVPDHEDRAKHFRKTEININNDNGHDNNETKTVMCIVLNVSHYVTFSHFLTYPF